MKKSLFLIPLLLVVAFLLPLTDCTHHSSGGNYGLLYSNLDPNVTYYTVEEAVEYIKSLDKEKDETYEVHIKDDEETSCKSLREALESIANLSDETSNSPEIKGPRIILDIENTILEIGTSAFSGTGSDRTWRYYLKEVILPKNCTEIGDEAFRLQVGLEKVTFPSSLTKIDYYAFHCCCALKELDLSNTQVEEIGECAFDVGLDNVLRESSLTSIKFPNTLKYLGMWSFEGCATKNIEIPKSVTTIGRRAFRLCSNLESITIENDPGKVWGHNPTCSTSSSGNYGEITTTATKGNTTIVHCFEENPMYFLTDDSIGSELELTCKCDCDEEKSCTCKELSRAGNLTNDNDADKWGCNYWWYRVSEQ